MSDNYKEHPLNYALDPSGKMVHILCVRRGLSCNCRCPKCNELLVAKLGHEGGRQPHFAHQGDHNCKGSYMSAVHKLAEQIIEEEKAVKAPAYHEISARTLSFCKVEVERCNDRKDLRPDLVGVTEDGLRWAIEIYYSNEVREEKRQKIIESNITCLEIDVREQTLENLKSFLLESTNSREWINNPNYDLQIANKKREKVFLVEKLFFDQQAFVIPGYGKYKMEKVHFAHISILFKSEDGLFVRVKADTTEGRSYIFNIGSQNILDNWRPTLKVDQNCNELAINTDSVYSDTVIRSCFLDTKWWYHYLSEQEHKAKEKRIEERQFFSSYKSRDSLILDIPQFHSIIVRKTETTNVVPTEEDIMINDLCGKLSNMEPFNNPKGETIKILYCKKAKRPYEIIVLYIKNGTYYLYGIALVEKRWKYYEISDYCSEQHANKQFSYMVSKWDYYEHLNDETTNPFEIVPF